jgi:3-dehydroquinate synthase
LRDETHIEEIFSSGYSVYAGKGSLNELEKFLSSATPQYSKHFILVDENTLQDCLPTLIAQVPALNRAEIVEIVSGERNKTIETCIQLWEVLTELNADRHAILINLGGGVISDLGGFVASTYKRGIDFVNIPTTLLSQVDASVGGKVGVDLMNLKNQVGAFSYPKGVFIDPVFLNTLPKNEVMSGFAEMLKHALIADIDLWYELMSFDWSMLEDIEPYIIRSVKIKNKIVMDDPREKGVRKLLNFGHTIGHAIESYSLENSGKELLHGEAIAIGMVCESYISSVLCELPQDQVEEITSFLMNHYPAFSLDSMAHHRLIETIRNDKKNRDNKMNFSLISAIGEGVYDQQVSADLVIDALNYYQSRQNAVTHGY